VAVAEATHPAYCNPITYELSDPSSWGYDPSLLASASPQPAISLAGTEISILAGEDDHIGTYTLLIKACLSHSGGAQTLCEDGADFSIFVKSPCDLPNNSFITSGFPPFLGQLAPFVFMVDLTEDANFSESVAFPWVNSHDASLGPTSAICGTTTYALSFSPSAAGMTASLDDVNTPNMVTITADVTVPGATYTFALVATLDAYSAVTESQTFAITVGGCPPAITAPAGVAGPFATPWYAASVTGTIASFISQYSQGACDYDYAVEVYDGATLITNGAIATFAADYETFTYGKCVGGPTTAGPDGDCGSAPFTETHELTILYKLVDSNGDTLTNGSGDLVQNDEKTFTIKYTDPCPADKIRAIAAPAGPILE
jgi:hypothetical protein